MALVQSEEQDILAIERSVEDYKKQLTRAETLAEQIETRWTSDLGTADVERVKEIAEGMDKKISELKTKRSSLIQECRKILGI